MEESFYRRKSGTSLIGRYYKERNIYIMILHITHNDLDGLSCVILQRLFPEFKDEVYTVYMDYESLYLIDQKFSDAWFKDLDYEGDFSRILITDIAVDETMLKWVKDTFTEYQIFDHHERSVVIDNEPNCYFSVNKCATKLYFDYLFKHKRSPSLLRHYVALVDVYDRHDDESPLWGDAQDMNRVFWGAMNYRYSNYLRYEKFLIYQMQKVMSSYQNFFFTDFEKVLIMKAVEREESEFRIAKKSGKFGVDNCGNQYFIWVGASKISAVGAKLLQEFPNVCYVLNLNNFGGSPSERVLNGKISARSRKKDEFDVTCLEGIEGHRSAGGGRFPPEKVLEIWELKSYLTYTPKKS